MYTFTIRYLIIHDPAYILNIHYLIIHDQVSRVIDQSSCIYPHRTISSERPWTKVEQFITVEREVTILSDWEIKIYNQNKKT
jgi:hypothetical protein